MYLVILGLAVFSNVKVSYFRIMYWTPWVDFSKLTPRISYFLFYFKWYLCDQAQQLLPVILGTREVVIGRITIWGQPRQKAHQSPISTNNKLGLVVCTCHPNYMESKDSRIMVQAGLGTNVKPNLKNNKNKKKELG
jgi:hypothetical protein